MSENDYLSTHEMMNDIDIKEFESNQRTRLEHLSIKYLNDQDKLFTKEEVLALCYEFFLFESKENILKAFEMKSNGETLDDLNQTLVMSGLMVRHYVETKIFNKERIKNEDVYGLLS